MHRFGKKKRVSFSKSIALLILALALLIAPANGISAAPLARNMDLPIGRFYTDANGQSGAGDTGYAVVDEYWRSSPSPNKSKFFSEFQRLNGVSGVGYPASRPFVWDNFNSQVMQKGVFQWRPEVGRVYFINVFDEMSKRGMDQRLYKELQVPYPLDWSSDAGLPWDQVVARHIALLDNFPKLRAQYFSIANPLDLYGLPVSNVVDFGPFYAVRLQRAVFQQYKIDTSYAHVGDVVVANGGDVAKLMGLIPADAAQPHGTPVWSDRIMVYDPNPSKTVGNSFRIWGDANVASGKVNWEIRATNGTMLKTGSFRTVFGGDWARFNTIIDMSGVPAQSDHSVVLRLYDGGSSSSAPQGIVEMKLTYNEVEQFKCSSSPDKTMTCTASGAGVTITIPWQGFNVKVQSLPLGSMPSSGNDNYTPFRQVINFVITNAQSGATLRNFSPPISFQVAYTKDDFMRAAQDNKQLVLGFWDPDLDQRWVSFDSSDYLQHPNNGYNLQGGPDGGIGNITAGTLGDPRYAWGDN